MKKINVIPAEGFSVKDHKGNLIPEEGAEVPDSPVVQRRIKEGLLIPAPTVPSQPDPDSGESESEIEIEKMTKTQLQAFLTENEIEFPASANKAELLEILDRETEVEG